MAATINDIARKTGVSPSTVSRVINGTAKISSSTKEKIYAAMNELNYHPNFIARSLAQGSGKTISLLIDAENRPETFSNMFFSQSVFGIEREAQRNGFSLLISGYTDDEIDSAIESLVLERKTDGIIIPSSIANPRIIRKLNRDGVAFVVLGEPSECPEQCSWIDINNFQGARLAVSHLIEKGYEDIIFFGGSKDQLFTLKRTEGFKSLVKNEDSVFSVEGGNDELIGKAGEILKAKKVDAVVCNDNRSAFAFVKAAEKAGLSIPDELGIITFDNYPLAEYMDPPLSVVSVDTIAQGETATSVLIQKLKEKGSDKQILISTGIIERASTRKNGR